MPPKVSIILPVYNSEKYLSIAIDSILDQTLSDFELIIINDGSTDSSEKIIRSYADHRIQYISNAGNKGLIYSLNKGVEISKGEYIARMDADDICFKDRIEHQVNLMEKDSSISITACHIIYIDENGAQTGIWDLENTTSSFSEVKKVLPRQNCIAHPSILSKASVLKKYRYAYYQKNIEDYDLWLRLLADGHKIEKVPIALLYYRHHQKSITNIALKSQNISFKHFKCKAKYLAYRVKAKRWSSFDNKILFYALIDFGTGVWKSFEFLFTSR